MLICYQMGRELGFQNGQHGDLQHITNHTFCWKDFVLKEELIRYGLFGLVR
jgi:hypothetical protein